MTRKYLCIAALASLMITSCNNKEDLYDADAVNANKTKTELENAETALGVNIDANQEWVLTNKYTIIFENLPSDIKTESIAILDANPLTDNSAAILAYAKKSETISFEGPKGLKRLFAACIDANDDIRVAEFDPNNGKVSFNQTKPYEVISSADQSRARRAFSAHRAKSMSELNWQNTTNAIQFPQSGWADQWAFIERGEQSAHFTNVNEYINIVHGFLPEGTLNYRDSLNKAEEIRNNFYAVVGEGGGEVSVTPIYRETSNKYSRFGYYYFLPNDAEQNVKTVRKFIFEEEVPFNYFKVKDIPDEQTLPIYRLTYYDENGNPSYTFPEGTKIGFFNVLPASNSLPGDLIWYNVTGVNYDLSDYLANRNVLPDWAKGYNVGWREYSHTIMFERAGVKFIGFEDWVKDFDMNDIVLMLDGNVEDMPIAPASSCKENIKYYRYSYGFEDTKNGDYDMNDVVLRVWRPRLNANFLNVELAAVGAEDEVYVYYKNQKGEEIALFDGKEVHQLFEEKGFSATFYNTPEVNATDLPLTTVQISDFNTFNYSRADFYIFNKTKNLTVHMPAAEGKRGVAPYGICVPQKEWKWPKERICITKAYEAFKAFATNQDDNVDWWQSPNESRVLTVPSQH